MLLIFRVNFDHQACAGGISNIGSSDSARKMTPPIHRGGVARAGEGRADQARARL